MSLSPIYPNPDFSDILILMYYFIVNRTGGSGRGKWTWKKVQKILNVNQIEYKAFFTGEDGSATEIAKQISSINMGDADGDGEKKSLVVVGGDGTINEVLNGLPHFDDLRFGLVPTGSGNDFARGIGIPKNTKKALHRILDSKSPKKIDLGRVRYDDGRSRYFGISSGLGLDAIVCKKALKSKMKKFLNKLGLGQAVYILLTIKTLFSMKTENLRVSFDGGSEQIFAKTIFMAMMNFKAEGGGVKMCPDAKSDDGKLSVCLVHGVKKFQTFFLLPFLMAGKHGRFKGFELLECKSAEINFDSPQTLHLDGEYGGEVSHVLVEAVESKLEIFA